LLGGSANDAAVGLALDTQGNAYVTGYANSTDFSTTSGVFQAANKAASSNGSNAFVSKFALATEANQTAYPTVVPSNIPTSITGSATLSVDCVDNQFSFSLFVSVNAGSFGPPPTGSLYVADDEQGQLNPIVVSGSWGGRILLRYKLHLH
jgi:hypothetical protein